MKKDSGSLAKSLKKQLFSGFWVLLLVFGILAAPAYGATLPLLKDFGLPKPQETSYPRGIDVCFDADYLIFEAKPLMRNNRVLVPAASLFSQLGGQVSQKGNTIIGDFPAGIRLELTEGNPYLQVKTQGQNGKTSKNEKTWMDISPFVETGCTYVSAYYVAEALGFDIKWNNYNQVLYLTDWDKLAKAADAEFSILNKVLAACLNGVVETEKTYASKEKLAVSGTLYTEQTGDRASSTLEGSSLLRDSKFCGDYTLNFDLGGFQDLVKADVSPETFKILESLQSGKYSARGDLAEESLYFKGSNLGELTKNKLPNNTWLDFGNSSGVVGDSLVLLATATENSATPVSVGTLLVEQAKLQEYGKPYDSFVGYLAFLRFIAADDCFKVATVGSTTTYSLQADAYSLMARAIKLGLIEKSQIIESEAKLANGKLPKLDYILSATVENQKLAASQFSGNFAMLSPIPFTMSFDFKTFGHSATGSCDLKGRYLGKMEMQFNSDLVESQATVLVAPEEQEKVIKVEELEKHESRIY